MNDDGRDEEETKRKTGKCPAAAHAASDNDTADDPDREPEDDTTEPRQDPNEHEESSHDADSNPSFDEVLNDNPEDELEPGSDYMVRATHVADDLLAASGIMSWILRQGRVYWKQG